MSKPSAVPLSYCAEQVRAHDPDRYVATLFAPADAREALFALYAFDHEIARVRDVVREPMAGLIRLQWWREALEAVAEERSPAHPVAEGLHGAWPALRRVRPRLEDAIDARERELDDEPVPDVAALARHLDATSGGIVHAALAILGVEDKPSAQAGRKVGLTLGIASLLRSIPHDARARRLMVPVELLWRHGVDREATFEGRHTPGLGAAVAELAARGEGALRSAQAHRHELPRAALPALLPGALAGDYLAKLRRKGCDPFAPAPRKRAAPAPLRLLWRHARGVF